LEFFFASEALCVSRVCCIAGPPAFREYVIVHELLHLKVPNHGKLFKSLLRAYIPNYEVVELTKIM
jgi:predicted metal-dependent hydrolase